MAFKRYPFASIAVLIVNLLAVFVSGQDLNCDPCIERPTYRIQAIVHGTSDDKFWQRMRSSLIQAATDMRVELDFELYDVFDPETMASDIEAVAADPSPPDALIVTIPSPIVETAVSNVRDQIPIFGMNSGYNLASSVGVLDFIAMDERLGGIVAAEEFLKEKSDVANALYINHAKENTALDERFIGFKEGLGKNSSANVDELIVDTSSPDNEAAELIASALEGCKYDAVLLAGSESTLQMTLEVFDECSNSYLGAFDESKRSYEAIATGRLLFTISQQAHLQGTLSVVAAAIFATTGKKLSGSQAAFGTYLSGPIPITFSNLPSDTLQTCEEEAFPVCSNTLAIDSVNASSCDCLDRSKIKIAGVLHGVTTDAFWDVVFAQASQAADDLGVELNIDRLEPQPDSKVLHDKMASRIKSLCNEGIDGIFISVPSELLKFAVQECHDLNVPLISVNAGASYAESLGIIHHIAQLEYDAGYEAGERMAKEGVSVGICLPHEKDNEAVNQRCTGFENGIKAASPNITYLGNHFVPPDSKLVYIDTVEKIIGKSGDWDGIGALSIGPTSLGSLLAVKERHPKLLVGTFDATAEVFEALESGNLLFGIDQNPFMQGYMPVWLLTLMAHTKQNLQNPYIKTGPRFVENAPSDALQTCTANHFKVCPRPVDSNLNQLTRIRPIGLALAGITMILSIILLAWIAYNRETTVVRKSQPLFLGMICVGTFLMAATIIPLSIDDSIASVEACTIACIATPWFFWIGFIFTFSALFSKLDRIKRLLDSAESFRKVTITAYDVMLPFLFLLTLTLIFLSVWTLLDPVYWVRQDVSGSVDGLSTFGSCSIGHGNVSKVMLACLIVLAFACVIRACISAWYGRSVSVEYSESKYISVIVIGMLQTFPIGIPLIILSYSNPTASYFVKAAIIFFLSMSILLLIFVPKIMFHRKEKNGNLVRASNLTSSSGMVDASGTINVSSLRVMGRNQFHRETVQSQPEQVETMVATEVVSGVTKKQVEDLKRVLKQTGKIDDATNLRSIVQSIGITITDEDLYPSSRGSISTMSDVPKEEQDSEQLEANMNSDGDIDITLGS